MKNCLLNYLNWRLSIPLLFAFLLSIPFAYSQNNVSVRGVVTDINGEPLIGVSVLEVGTAHGTVSDIDGNYSLDVNGMESTLKFSYIGFEEKQIKVGNQTLINVTMNEMTSELDEVVIVGYGTMKKKDLTGSVASLNSAKYENEKNKNVQQMLRGNIPGLNIGITRDAKGSSGLEIRGQRSLSASSSPLIVLDGVIYNGDLSDINPNDIQSIDVLKDASSAAVFGAKSANGVVLVNTKSGTSEKPTIGFDMSAGAISLFRRAEVYGPQGFIDWRSDVLKSINRSAPTYVFDNPNNLPSGVTKEEWLKYDNSQGDPTDVWLRRLGLSQVERDNYFNNSSTDWANMVFVSGIQQSYNVNVSGKSDRLNYYWSLGYDDNEGVIEFDKYSVYRSRIKLDARITNFLSVGINSLFSLRNEPSSTADWGMVDNISPWGQPTNPDGTMKIYPTDDAVAAKHPLIDNSYTTKDYQYKSLDNVLFAKLTLPYDIQYELKYSPRFTNNELYLHQSSKHPEYNKFGGSATRNTSSGLYWQVDNILSWNKTFNNTHTLNATLLYNAEKSQGWQQTMTGQSFVPYDALGYHNMGSATVTTLSSNDTYSSGIAYMARLFYSYKSKYLLTGTVRRDGYSAFGMGNPYATFPSLALAWVFSEEDYLKNVDWFDYGKLRLSWGSTGNRSIGIYDALSTLNNGLITYVNDAGSAYQESYLYSNRMGNRKLQWETTTSYNAGIDFTVLGQRINGSIDLYSMDTKDLLVNRSLPTVTGYTSVTTNLGKVNNKGVEFTLTTKNISRPNFNWNTTLNVSYNRNRIVKLYGNMEDIVDANGVVIGQKEKDDISNGWFIDHAINEIWDYKIMGVWQVGEEEEAAKYKLAPGDFKLEDVNGDYKFTNDDKSFQGYKTPPVRWSLRNEFNLFENFDLSFLIYSNWNYKQAFNEAKHNPSMTLSRFNSYIVPYWTEDNPTNKFARLNSNLAGVTYNVWQNMSFVRLDNISLGYTVPRQVAQNLKLETLRFSLSSRNLALLTKEFVMWDPEYAGPTPSYVTFGINFSL